MQKKGDDSVVKLRPVVPRTSRTTFRGLPDFGVEVDAMPGGFVLGIDEGRAAPRGRRPRSRRREAPPTPLVHEGATGVHAEHAPEGFALDDLSVLGPIFVLKLKYTPKGLNRRLVAELWLYPDNSRILELSTKCEPSEAFQVAAETRAFLTERGVDFERRAGDEDPEGPRVLLRAPEVDPQRAGRGCLKTLTNRFATVCRLGSLVPVAAVALCWCATASADLADETALAERHAPLVRLVEQLEVRARRALPADRRRPALRRATVSLRGPWNPADLIEVGPAADDLADLFQYHLDFPGTRSTPVRLRALGAAAAGETPTVYSHVATTPAIGAARAPVLALLHVQRLEQPARRGLEMITLLFEAADARRGTHGRNRSRSDTGQHEGAERADWGTKLELVDGRRPVVYPAEGSHPRLFSRPRSTSEAPPSRASAATTRAGRTPTSTRRWWRYRAIRRQRAPLPWITFEGRWARAPGSLLQRSFGSEPEAPMDGAGRVVGGLAAAELRRADRRCLRDRGDRLLHGRRAGLGRPRPPVRNPLPMLVLIASILALVVLVAVRATWRPVAPFRLARRRAWGQTLAAAGHACTGRGRGSSSGSGSCSSRSAVISIVQALVLGGFGLLGIDTTGESAGGLVILVVAIGTTLALLGLALVQAATASALVELDEGREIGPLDAYRMVFGKIRPLIGALALAVAIWFALGISAFLLPVAIWLAVRRGLLAQVVRLENRPAAAALRRSSELVRGRWLRVASLVGVGAVLAFAAGPLLGALLILLASAPLPLLNLVAGIVYALALPFVALTTSYVYFDARARHELERAQEPDELPAEIRL